MYNNSITIERILKMNDFESYEYVIKPKKDGKNRTRRALLLLLYVAFVIAWLFFGFFTRILVPLLALIPLTTWMLVFFTWRYVNVEYEYSVESGVVTFSKIYGGRSRRAVLSFDLRDAEVILPLGEHSTRRALDDFDPRREYFFAESEETPDSFVALCTDEDGEKLSVSFTADARLLRLMKLYNFRALGSQNIAH